jgi:hypothetical protein
MQLRPLSSAMEYVLPQQGADSVIDALRLRISTWGPSLRTQCDTLHGRQEALNISKLE